MILVSLSLSSGKNQIRKRTARPAGPFRVPHLSSSLSASSSAALYPLLASGHSTLDVVSQDHKKRFGTEPRHPQGGAYSWDGYELSSSQYGTQSNKTRPQYEAGNRDFGLLSHFETFSVEMQFEQDGLRTRLFWKLSDD